MQALNVVATSLCNNQQCQAYGSKVTAGCISGTSNYSDLWLKRSRRFSREWLWREVLQTAQPLVKWRYLEMGQSPEQPRKTESWGLYVSSAAHSFCSSVTVDALHEHFGLIQMCTLELDVLLNPTCSGSQFLDSTCFFKVTKSSPGWQLCRCNSYGALGWVLIWGNPALKCL